MSVEDSLRLASGEHSLDPGAAVASLRHGEAMLRIDGQDDNVRSLRRSAAAA
jgi:hypothetical protein